jgi:hypothetical protein
MSLVLPNIVSVLNSTNWVL